MKNVDTDLFGDLAVQPGRNPLPVPEQRAPTNDMALLEHVLRVAGSDRGYVLAGTTGRAFRLTDRPIQVHGKRLDGEEIEAIPADEDRLVHQLVGTGHFTTAGQRTYRWRNNRECAGYLVLVPKKTRQLTARWSHLRRPEGWAMQAKPASKKTTGKG